MRIGRNIRQGHNGGLRGAFSNLYKLSVTRLLGLLYTVDWPEHDLF